MTSELQPAKTRLPAAIAVFAAVLFMAGVCWLALQPKADAPKVVEPVPAGKSPKPPVQTAEEKLTELQKVLDGGHLAVAFDLLGDMITLYPDSPSTVRAFTRVSARRDEVEEPKLAQDYRKKYVALAPTVYDDLIKPLNIVDARGFLVKAVLALPLEQRDEALKLYMEKGYMQRELGKTQKAQFDNASMVFADVARVATPQTELWWTCKYEILATLVARGADIDFKLAKVGMENLERAQPEFDQGKYAMKDRFLKLKKKILDQLLPK